MDIFMAGSLSKTRADSQSIFSLRILHFQLYHLLHSNGLFCVLVQFLSQSTLDS